MGHEGTMTTTIRQYDYTQGTNEIEEAGYENMTTEG
jgi:hypothetical protein